MNIKPNEPRNHNWAELFTLSQGGRKGAFSPRVFLVLAKVSFWEEISRSRGVNINGLFWPKNLLKS